MDTGSKAAFNLSNWRESVQARRELVRGIIIRAAVSGERLEHMLDEMRSAIGYARLNENDRNLFNVTIHDMRTIVSGWKHLTPVEQAQFVAGKGAPSSLAKKVRREIR